MRNDATKRQWALALISVVVLVAVTVVSFMTREEPPSDFSLIMKETMEQIEKQSQVDQNIMAEIHSGAYTFESPLVVVDPYDISPLTALAAFTSDEPLRISIHIEGITELADVNYSFEGYKTEHIVPIYGLYAGSNNKVLLIAENNAGQQRQVELEVTTDPISQYLEHDIFVKLNQPDRYQPGFNFTYAHKSAFDVNGDYRWYFPGEYLWATNYQCKYGIVLARGSYHEGDVLFIITNLLGGIDSVFYSPYGVHHDIEIFKEGRMLITGSHGETVEDFIYEMNMETGVVESTLDLKQVLQRDRAFIMTSGYFDWFHLNNIEWETDTDNIIISGRHQGVMKLSWPDGKLDWILSPHDGWNEQFRKYLISPVGMDFEWPYGQHTPTKLPDYDNNPDTVDILVFDNGNSRFDRDKKARLKRSQDETEVTESDLYSRIVHYRINEKEKTVEQIWQFGKEYGVSLYSASKGSSCLLSNGNRLGLFDLNQQEWNNCGIRYIETSYNGIVWEAFGAPKQPDSKIYSYRVERMQIYNDSSDRPWIGEPVKNLIPAEVLEKYGY